MSKLLDIAEGIMDTAAEEFRTINLASYQAVQEYAHVVEDVVLSKHEAELIRIVCMVWLKRQFSLGSMDYYWYFKRPLLDEEEISQGM
jgi:hypothetical protein